MRAGVVMVIAKFFPEMGGAENQARRLSASLQACGWTVFVLTRNYHKGPAREWVDGLEIIRTPTFGNSRVLNSLSYFVCGFWQLWRRRRTFSIIHCHQMYSPTTLGVVAGTILRKPVVVKVTASQDLGEVRELKRLPGLRLRRYLLQKVKRFIAVNPTITEELAELGIAARRVMWIPNGVDLPSESSLVAQAQRQARLTLGLQDASAVVLYSGRLSEEKRLDTLLHAWKIVAPDFPRARLLILGEGGAERNVGVAMQKLAMDLELGSSVRFTGRVSPVAPYLMAGDVFVLPSISEGMSNALLEAMAYGLACVVSDIPANRTLLQPDTEARMFAVGHAAALAEHLRAVLGHAAERERLGKAARAKAERCFSLHEVTGKIIALYGDVSKVQP